MSKGEEGFQRVANKVDIKEGGLVGVELEGNKIVLAMINGQVFAIDAVCSHKGAPLEEGKLEGYNLTCPWHYAVFDVRNGKVSDRRAVKKRLILLRDTIISSFSVTYSFPALMKGKRTEATCDLSLTDF